MNSYILLHKNTCVMELGGHMTRMIYSLSVLKLHVACFFVVIFCFVLVVFFVCLLLIFSVGLSRRETSSVFPHLDMLSF